MRPAAPPDATTEPGYRPSPIRFAMTLSVVALGLLPLPAGLGSIRDAARSLEPNHADREAGSGGYYEGLIEGVDDPKGARSELTLRLLGKPVEWVRFQAAEVARPTVRDFLQFELKPDLDQVVFGGHFTTNRHGMRDRDYAVAKPPGTFRVALLGSSIDMGWGVGDDETYENRLEDWLNAQAIAWGLDRRFEVLNFAVAAYGPAQRFATLSRKAAAFDPDLVIYSATMLDARLLELHLCGLLARKVDPTYPFLRHALADAGIVPEDAETDGRGNFLRKDSAKLKLRGQYWPIVDATLDALAADCRSRDLPLWLISIPRASRADAPDARAGTVARLAGIAARLAIPYVDLMPEFDGHDTAEVELASWDDHPNASGHRRIFLGLARTIADRPELSALLFGPDLSVTSLNP